MDVLENILTKLGEVEDEKTELLKRIETCDGTIARLEQMYSYLEDPSTAELMRDVLVGLAVQSGAPVPNGNVGGSGEKHYVGMQRVRDYVAQMQPGQPFTVHDVFLKSVEHRSPEPKLRHPEFEKQRKASISVALSSLAKCGDLDVVKQGRGREATVFRRPEVRA